MVYPCFVCRLRNAQDEMIKLEQQLVFIGRQSEATTKQLHSLQERKYSLSCNLNKQEDHFNHMITGNHGFFVAGSLGEAAATNSSNLVSV